ncbi:MAG TPA: hypothetical protein VFG19_02030 [Geobacteraceae bacterium]|nr:hypothetical protein [Geobacteraceae bacterium]
MRKIGIGNFHLPAGKASMANSGRVMWGRELDELKSVASGKVLEIAHRAVERAERYGCGHPFWNGLANCYAKISRQMETLNGLFPGITRVIHNSEVKKGDVLVCDFHIGLNYGYMNGGVEPVKIRALEIDGDTLKGAVMEAGNDENREIGYFKNELWFFISHRFAIYTSGKSSKR